MWSEEWDKKIQSAAGNSQPEFQEKSWDQMEALLEKHLPAEKKRRRLFILFFTLLTTGALVFLILLQRPAKPNLISTKQTAQAPTVAPLPDAGKEKKEAAGKKTPLSAADAGLVRDETTPVSNVGPATKPATRYAPAHTGMVPRKSKRTPQELNVSAPAEPENIRKRDVAIQQKTANRPAEDNSNETKTTLIIGNDTNPVKTSVPQTETTAEVPAIADSSTTDKKDEQTAADSAAIAEAAKPAGKTGKAAKSFSKRLGIIASLGVDINGVRLNKLNNAKTVWGVGLSYDISRRLTLRTGFFASRKIYVANPSDYHPPYNFWNYYPNLQKIDANCMIYEIPLSVIYNGGNTAKSHWFASAGLSSLIMKSEEYGYSYKDASGQPRYYSRSIYNKNQHLFSTLQLSGGYNIRLSSRSSLLAEPYLKLPLSGVGYGKVRLYSAGVMLTAIVKPFAKN